MQTENEEVTGDMEDNAEKIIGKFYVGLSNPDYVSVSFHVYVFLLLERLPTDLKVLESCWKSWQNCMLLLHLRQHLKETYNLHDRLVQFQFTWTNAKF